MKSKEKIIVNRIKNKILKLYTGRLQPPGEGNFLSQNSKWILLIIVTKNFQTHENCQMNFNGFKKNVNVLFVFLLFFYLVKSILSIL